MARYKTILLGKENGRKIILRKIVIEKGTDSEFKKIKRDLGLGLEPAEIRKISEELKKRTLTDCELFAYDIEWSEHCSYKTSKPILKKHGILKKESELPPHIIMGPVEDAGVVEFDKDHAYVVAMESHNHPSAVEPWGGAATGIGGILRDVFCMGAQPIACTDPLFFGSLNMDLAELPEGVKHPKYIMAGVVKGIADYGNCCGIPTVTGITRFEECYTGNCIVNVVCVGVARKESVVRSEAKNPGDYLVLVGSTTGRDGIGGVTFASEDLREESEIESRPAVQLGDPYVKEPLMHVTLEALEKKYLSGLKDLGGGGICCSTSELVSRGGCGAEIWLDRVHRREVGMDPWEILVSESQERMMFVVPPQHLADVTRICEKWDVPYALVGKVTDTGRYVVRYGERTVVDVPAQHLTGGIVYHRPMKKPPIKFREPEIREPNDLGDVILRLLGSPNIASKEWVWRQYDHEVRGNTVIKPPNDASVLKPLRTSWRGIAVANACNPRICYISPYEGAKGAVAEAFRNLACVGARYQALLDCLNFGNPEKPEILWQFDQTVRGLGEAAEHFEAPYISGNVSFYNEYSERGEAVAVYPTPSITAVGAVKDIRKATTMDVKNPGNKIYLIGETKRELGGSEYYKIHGELGASVPKVSLEKEKKTIDLVLDLITKSAVCTVHDLAKGGLAIGILEMLFPNGYGAIINLDKVPSENLRSDYLLFSETHGRFLLESSNSLNGYFKEHEVIHSEIGAVIEEPILKFERNNETILELDVREAREIYDQALARRLG